MAVESETAADGSSRTRRAVRAVARMADGVLHADPVEVQQAAIDLGRSRRWLSPLAFVAGTLGLVIVGIKPLIKNWRLTLIEAVPAAWVWISMWNLKSHLLDQRGVHQVHEAWYLPATLVFIAMALLAFWCNAVFIFAIGDSPPLLRPAFARANQHWRTVAFWGVLVGGLHAFVSLYVSMVSKLAYDVSLSAIVALMMVTFVTVPASLAGISKRKEAPRDKAARVAVGSTIAAVASTPGFIFDRIGLLMIGSKTLRIPGFAILSLGVALQVAATSSTKAVKISTRLAAQDGVADVATDTPSDEGAR